MGKIIIRGNNVWFSESEKRKKAVSSVPTPNAQTNTLCKSRNGRSEIAKQLAEKVESLKYENPKLYYFASLQQNFGLRVSEVLNISSGDIQPDGRIIIRGLKGSENRMVFSESGRKFFLNCRKYSIKPFADFDRYYINREYLKKSIFIKFANSDKKAVTHCFRHLYLTNLNSDVDTDTKRKAIGQKSINSTKHYEQKK